MSDQIQMRRVAVYVEPFDAELVNQGAPIPVVIQQRLEIRETGEPREGYVPAVLDMWAAAEVPGSVVAALLRSIADEFEKGFEGHGKESHWTTAAYLIDSMATD